MVTFIPGEPDGTNASLTSAISRTGAPTLGKTYEVPARSGVAVEVDQGQTLTVVNTHGTQVCDFWAFNRANLDECLSMEHLHTALGSIYPKAGDTLVSNMRRPMLTFLEDTSPGVHDTVIAACDHHRYQSLGCEAYHDNCTDNMRLALIAIGDCATQVPSPFNLWMNTPVAADGSVSWLPTVSKPGDYVRFEAHFRLLAVMSACPQDMMPINGEDGMPTNLHFRVD